MKIHTVSYREGNQWIVQGLEHDICACGETKDIARYRFEVAKNCEAEEPGGLERIPPAPEKFWKMKDDPRKAHTLGDAALNPDGTYNGARALSWLSAAICKGDGIPVEEIEDMWDDLKNKQPSEVVDRLRDY